MQVAPGFSVRLGLGVLAFLGLIGGHVGAYSVVAPDPAHHDELLQVTGHGSGWVLIALVAAVLASSVASFARRSSVRHSGRRLQLLTATWLRLAFVQFAGFLLLESFERATSGGSIGSLLAEPVVVVGALAQLVVALLGAGLVVAVARAVTSLRRRRLAWSDDPDSDGFLPVSSVVPLHRSVACAAWNLRGPPALL